MGRVLRDICSVRQVQVPGLNVQLCLPRETTCGPKKGLPGELMGMEAPREPFWVLLCPVLLPQPLVQGVQG